MQIIEPTIRENAVNHRVFANRLIKEICIAPGKPSMA